MNYINKNWEEDFIEDIKNKKYHNKNIELLTHNSFSYDDIIKHYKDILKSTKKEECYRELLLKESEDKLNYMLWGISVGNAKVVDHIYTLLKTMQSKERLKGDVENGQKGIY